MVRVVRGWKGDWVLGAILVGAFLGRLGYGLFAGLGTPPDGRPFVIDEQEYYLAAHMLANGHGFSFYDTFIWTRAPLYPLFVAAIFRLVGVQVAPVLWVQAALSTLTLYWLATLAGRVAAPFLSVTAARRGAALVGALWLSFTLFAQLLVSETLFLCLFVGALVVLARWADRREVTSATRERWLLLSGAGALLGLAALTRSTALVFVPLVALWVAWAGGRTSAGRARWLAPALVLGAALLVIAPWTARNIVAYGLSPSGPVLIDTSSGYNLWLAANGVRDGERLASELRGIPGVLARQQHATTQAQAQIAADPGAFVAKGLKESLDLWTINSSAEERQVGGATAGRVPPQHLLSVLVLEDGLYLVIGVLALLGLAVAPPDPLKGLIGLWIVLWLGTAFVFFAVTRFRFPVVACLLPWVPVGAAWLRQRVGRRVVARSPATGQIVGLLAAVFLLIVGPTLPLGATATGVTRWVEQAPFRAGEAALRDVDPVAALSQYAQANQSLPDTQFGTLAAQIAANPTAPVQLDILARSPALDLSAAGVYSTRMEPYLLQGQIARLKGDTAQAARLFTSRPVNDAGMAALDWAAEHFPTIVTNTTSRGAVTSIDVGSGLDVGQVEGFYGPERDSDVTYRWTGQTIVTEAHGPYPELWSTLRVRWNGWRPAGWPPATVVVTSHHCGVDVCIDKRQVVEVPNDTQWHDADLDIGPFRIVRLSVTVNTFVPGGSDPRELGIKIDRMEWIR